MSILVSLVQVFPLAGRALQSQQGREGHSLTGVSLGQVYTHVEGYPGQRALTGRSLHRGGTSSGFQLNWKLLFVFAAINLVLGLSSHSQTAYVTAGIFVVLGAIVLFRQMAKQGPVAPPAVGNPPIPPKTSGGQLLTKEMVSKLPANESNFLISRKPIVDVILKELRANRTICVSSFAQRNNVSIRRNAYCSGERSSLLLQKIEIL